MDWLQSLLWDPSSVAHIVFLYAFVVAAGVYLGKIKIFGVSLGVTFVLFAGILMGHFGFTADTHILHFIREFGLILFVFCIGLQLCRDGKTLRNRQTQSGHLSQIGALAAEKIPHAGIAF